MKILVFTVSAWNSKVGSNTWATLLSQYDSENIANIFIRNETPDSSVCSRYFRISENKILKSVFNRKIKTGEEVVLKQSQANSEDLAEHNLRYEKFRKKRRYSLLMARELAWKFGKWKTKELNEFLDDFKPDIILHSMEGYIHLNRIIEYAIKRTGAKAIGYVWDDNFTYKQSSKTGYKIYRYFQRKSLKKLAKRTESFFAISPKTKREADEFFGIDSTIITKPLNVIPKAHNYENQTYPIKILYTGNLLIGRDKSLKKLVDAIATIPSGSQKFQIEVYTQTKLNEQVLSAIDCEFCKIYPPISQREVLQKQKEADVLLFLEDIDGKESKTARLSFSTKITDYLSSGKCIFAIGNKDLAPIEYFIENDAAIVAINENDVKSRLNDIICGGESFLREYAKKAVECGIKNHGKKEILAIINEAINRLM